jgi:hypothetical protein
MVSTLHFSGCNSILIPIKCISNEEFQKQCKMTGKINTIKDINITENGVHKLLKNLNPNKAAGPDNITPRVLKELATVLNPLICFSCDPIMFQLINDKVMADLIKSFGKIHYVCLFSLV